MAPPERSGAPQAPDGLTSAGMPLGGGRTTPGVVRVGDTVRRPQGPQSPFVHELLEHPAAKRFPGAPRFLGVDERGREILSFLPGTVPPDLGTFSTTPPCAAARLLRAFHDATSDLKLCEGREVVCHGDASPCNAVFQEGLPYAWIDFDNAHPGSRIEDVGYAAWPCNRIDAPQGSREWALDCSAWTVEHLSTNDGICPRRER